MAKPLSLDEILELTKHLSLLDKVRLIEEIAPQIKRDLTVAQPPPRTQLHGLWQGVSTSDEDIVAARAELWGDFPHKDI